MIAWKNTTEKSFSNWNRTKMKEKADYISMKWDCKTLPYNNTIHNLVKIPQPKYEDK